MNLVIVGFVIFFLIGVIVFFDSVLYLIFLLHRLLNFLSTHILRFTMHILNNHLLTLNTSRTFLLLLLLLLILLLVYISLENLLGEGELIRVLFVLCLQVL